MKKVLTGGVKVYFVFCILFLGGRCFEKVRDFPTRFMVDRVPQSRVQCRRDDAITFLPQKLLGQKFIPFVDILNFD